MADFETITVEIPGGPGDWDQATHAVRRYEAEALLVPEARVQNAYSNDVRLRLPEGVGVGDRIALRRDPPGEAIFDILEEERDVNDKPLWRARIARPPVEAKHLGDPFEEAERFKRQERERQNASWKRIERKQAELIERTLAPFDDDSLRALVAYFETTKGAFGEVHNLCNAARERLAEVEREPSSVG